MRMPTSNWLTVINKQKQKKQQEILLQYCSQFCHYADNKTTPNLLSNSAVNKVVRAYEVRALGD